MDYRKGGFILPDCYDYIPAIQLCVCYDKLGEVEKAKAYNDKAGSTNQMHRHFAQQNILIKIKISLIFMDPLSRNVIL